MICITRIIRCYFCSIVSVRCDSQDSSVCRDNFNVRSDDTKRMIEHWAESIGERTGLGKISRIGRTFPATMPWEIVRMPGAITFRMKGIRKGEIPSSAPQGNRP